MASAVEVFAVTTQVQSHFSPNQKEELIGRLKKHAARILPMSAMKQMVTNIACPMLVEGQCSVYVARPLACRGYHSLDAASCEETYDDPSDITSQSPRIPKLQRVSFQIQAAAGGVFQAAGYDTTAYELGSALFVALTKGTCSRDFFEGRSAFPGAKRWEA